MRVVNSDAAATYLGQQNGEWFDYDVGSPQPYPTAATPFVPFSEAVYLALTEQEVSAVEDPALREPALGGPDTAARTRLIQRVQRLKFPGGSCDLAIETVAKDVYGERAGFDHATMQLQSTARLRADFVPSTDAPDLCQPTAQPGFLGPDNQLIRVQVSAPNTLLWGWDNASFLYRLTLTPGPPLVIALDSIPVDGFHQPTSGQWVELLGTAVDIHGEAQIGEEVGLSLQIDEYHETARTVTFQTTAAVLDDFANKHPQPWFLRMWENQIPISADPTAALELKDKEGTSTGVRVFTKGAALAVGDYWTIGVRPSTPQAILPARLANWQWPDGPRRWLAPLAVIDWQGPNTATVTDCRPPFLDLVDLTARKGGGGSCELVVAPGESIQAALDSLPPEGGAVCLRAGTHKIQEAIRIEKSGVTLHGESGGTVVEWDAPAPVVTPEVGPPAQVPVLMLEVRPAGQVPLPQMVADVTVRDLSFALGAGLVNVGGTFVLVKQCARPEIRNCRFNGPPAGPFLGVSLSACLDPVVADSRFGHVSVGIMGQSCLGRIDVRRNSLQRLVDPQTTGSTDDGSNVYGIQLPTTAFASRARIEHNQIEGFDVGITLGEGLEGSTITDNIISRNAGAVADGPPSLTDPAALRAYLDSRFYAIACISPSCAIRGNHIDLRSPLWGGISVGGMRTLVEDNQIEASSFPENGILPAGIYCKPPFELGEGAHYALVRDNVLLGAQACITVLSCNGVEVSRNQIDGQAQAWYGVRMDAASRTMVRDNEIRQTLVPGMHGAIFTSGGASNRFEGNRIVRSSGGITVSAEIDVEVSRNSVEAAARAGLFLHFDRSAAVCGNRVANCAYDKTIPFAAIVALGGGDTSTLSTLRIEGCEILDSGLEDGSPPASPAMGIMVDGVFACELVGNRVGYTALDSLSSSTVPCGGVAVGGSKPPDDNKDSAVGYALVSDNSFAGVSPAILTLVQAFKTITFSNNICRQIAIPGNNIPTVRLSGAHLVVMGNQIEADSPAVPSLSVDQGPQAVLLGNVTTGDIIDIAGAIVPPFPPFPLLDFNAKI
jgi:hypothetical protein